MPRTDLVKQEATRFLGVNLRQDRMDLADEEVAKAVNADFNTTVGTILLRLGKTKQFTSSLSDLVIRFLAKINSKRYQVAGQSLYRDQAVIINGLLSSDLKTTVIPYRPLNDTSIWAFIADGSLMRKDDGTNTYNWGIAAPTATPGVAAGGGTGLTGSYKVKFTYIRKTGSSVAHESSPSPASATQTLANQDLSITGMTASGDAQVTHKRVYRTVSGGALYLFDQEITNATTTATSTQADSALGSAVENDNDVPTNNTWAAEYNETIFLLGNSANPQFLYFSKRLRPESVPNHIEIGNADDPLLCAISISGVLGVFTRLTKYRVTGNASSGYVPFQHLSRRGTPSPYAAIATEYGIVFPAKDGVYSTNLMGPDIQIADNILPLFIGETVNGLSPINWTQAAKFRGTAFKNKYYFSYASGSSAQPDKVAVYSHDTKKWYFFDMPVTAMMIEEDIDDLVTGSTDGFVYVLEDGSTDAGSNIALDVETKDFFGQVPHGRKLFFFFRVDANVPSGTLNAGFYIDGSLKRTASITGNRTKLLLRLPDEAMGYQWRINFTYTGSGRVAIYGCAAIWLPLSMA